MRAVCSHAQACITSRHPTAACSQLLYVAGRHTSKHSDLVQKQLTGTVAVLLKRGWADDTPQERHAFFSEVEHTVTGSNDGNARRTGIEILEVGSFEIICMSCKRQTRLSCGC